jgi:hypothetical protein
MTGSPASPIRADEATAGQVVVLGLVASPGAATDLARKLLDDLTAGLDRAIPGARWTVRLESDRLVDLPTDLGQLVLAARRRLLVDGWHLAVCLTDLPLRTARRPVVAHASTTHGVAVLSLPALGPVAVAPRAVDGLVRLVASLMGGASGPDDDPSGGRRRAAATGRRAEQLRGLAELDDQGGGVLTGVVTGHLRLLLGMIRVNRPWRLAIRLSRALVAALAAAIFALVTSDLWRLSDALGVARQVALAVGSVTAVVLTIVVGARLLERAPAGSPVRAQVVLFNIVTVATVLIGVVALYLALFVLNLLGVLLLVPGSLLANALGHAVGIGDQLELAWLATSVATVGGALGAGLETDEAVREAAYTYAPDAELSRR